MTKIFGAPNANATPFFFDIFTINLVSQKKFRVEATPQYIRATLSNYNKATPCLCENLTTIY